MCLPATNPIQKASLQCLGPLQLVKKKEIFKRLKVKTHFFFMIFLPTKLQSLKKEGSIILLTWQFMIGKLGDKQLVRVIFFSSHNYLELLGATTTWTSFCFFLLKIKNLPTNGKKIIH